MEHQIETVLRGGQFKKLVTSQLAGIRKKYGLRRVEMEILYFLSKCGDNNTSKDIAHYLEMNKGHISQAVENLCKQGYLTAVTDVHDRRYVHFLVTDKGKVFNEDMSELWGNMLQKIFDGITEEEMAVFKAVALKMGENMDRMINE